MRLKRTGENRGPLKPQVVKRLSFKARIGERQRRVSARQNTMQQLGLAYTPKTQSRLRELLWPDVDNPVAIKTVCHTGMWVSFVVGGLTALFTIIGGHFLGGFVPGAIFVSIGIGIRKYSRISAILGALLYPRPHTATTSFPLVSVIFSFLFIT